MKVPKKFKVFGKTIKIKVGDLGGQYDGMFYPHQDLIVIDKAVPKERIAHVLIHEFIHSVITRCSLDQVISYPSEELVVDMIAKALVENFTIDNK